MRIDEIIAFEIERDARKQIPSGNAKRRAFYASRPWRSARYEALKRHGGKCQAYGRGAADGVVVCIDHIRPLRKFWELRLDPEIFSAFVLNVI